MSGLVGLPVEACHPTAHDLLSDGGDAMGSTLAALALVVILVMASAVLVVLVRL